MKPSIRIWIIGCIIFCGSMLQAQDVYFNNLYRYYSEDFGSSIVTKDNGYIVAGVSLLNGLKKLGLLEIDLQGNRLQWRVYGPGNYHTYSGMPGSFIKTSDGGYVIFTTLESSDTVKGYFIKFNSRLDTLWTKVFTDTIRNSLIGYQCKELENGGYILAGSMKGSVNIGIVLIRIDKYGNEIWRKVIDNEKIYRSYNIILIPGGYLIGGLSYRLGYYGTADPLVIKTDTSGNLIWAKTYGGPLDDYEAKVTLLSDGNYLITTTYGEDQPYPHPWVVYVKKHNLKIDTAGNIIWNKKYGISRPLIYPECSIELHDGCIVTCGFTWQDTSSVDTIGEMGYMMKTDQFGDSMWYKEYKNGPFNEFSWGGFNHFKLTDDGGFIACGFRYKDQVQAKYWVVKMDSLGCDTIACNPWVGVHEEILDMHVIGVYPNPAKGKITFALENTQHHKNITLQCYNIFGSLLEEQQIIPGQLEAECDVSKWDSGMYVVVVRSDGKVLGESRFVVRD